MKHLLKLQDLSTHDILDILNLADQLKYETKHGIEHHLLKGKTLGMIFQKSSTRTRVSFETGMYQLGGQALFLSNRDLQIGPISTETSLPAPANMKHPFGSATIISLHKTLQTTVTSTILHKSCF